MFVSSGPSGCVCMMCCVAWRIRSRTSKLKGFDWKRGEQAVCSALQQNVITISCLQEEKKQGQTLKKTSCCLCGSDLSDVISWFREVYLLTRTFRGWGWCNGCVPLKKVVMKCQTSSDEARLSGCSDGFVWWRRGEYSQNFFAGVMFQVEKSSSD